MNEQKLIQFLILRNESLAEELGRIKGLTQATIRGPQALNETVNEVLGKDVSDDDEEESDEDEEDHAGESIFDSIAEVFGNMFGQKQEE